MELKFLTLPFIGALIGWITNVLAIKLIFRPHKPVRIPLTNRYFQGLIPKRHQEIAAAVGNIIEEQLISTDEITDLIKSSEAKQKLVCFLIPALRKNFEDRLPNFIPKFIRNTAGDYFEEVLKRETPYLVGRMTTGVASEIKNEINFSTMVRNKINAFDLAYLEKLVLKLAHRELRHIEYLGAVLGFVIGFLQVCILLLI